MIHNFHILPPMAIQVAVKEDPSLVAGNTNEWSPNSALGMASIIVIFCMGTETQ